MSLRLKEQFVYKLPGNWYEYLLGQKGLESFKFYPLVLALLFITLMFMVISFFLATRKKRNRPLSRFLKLIGKVMLWEFILGAFFIFSRWQTLGFFAIRLFLLIWLSSVPLSIVVLVILYMLKFRKVIKMATEEIRLSKYKP